MLNDWLYPNVSQSWIVTQPAMIISGTGSVSMSCENHSFTRPEFHFWAIFLCSSAALNFRLSFIILLFLSFDSNLIILLIWNFVAGKFPMLKKFRYKKLFANVVCKSSLKQSILDDRSIASSRISVGQVLEEIQTKDWFACFREERARASVFFYINHRASFCFLLFSTDSCVISVSSHGVPGHFKS